MSKNENEGEIKVIQEILSSPESPQRRVKIRRVQSEREKARKKKALMKKHGIRKKKKKKQQKPKIKTRKGLPVGENGSFYSSMEWRQLRYKVIKKYRPKGCMACLNEFTRQNPMNVDHIKPISKHPELALDINNLQVLCSDCNAGKYNRDETDWRKRS